MIQFLRDKAHRWVSLVLVIVVSLSFALLGVNEYLGGGRGQGVAAKVNGVEISWQEVDGMAQRLERQQPQNPEQAQALKNKILQGLIEEQVLIQYAKKLGLVVPEQALQALIASIPEFQENGKFSAERMHMVLQANQLSSDAFLAMFKKNLLIRQLQTGVGQSTFVLPFEAELITKLFEQKRAVRVLSLPKKPLLQKVKFQPEMAKAYYDANPSEFMSPEHFKGKYIELKLADYLSKVAVTDAELKKVYEENIAQYQVPAQIKVAHILVSSEEGKESEAEATLQKIQESLKKGEKFSALAKKYSQDPSSAEQGGALDWMSKGDFVPEFEAAAFALQNKGDVSSVVKTPYGLHLIQLLNKKSAQTQSFETVKAAIKTQKMSEKAEEALLQDVEQLSDGLYDKAEGMDTVAAAIHKKLESFNLAANETTGILQYTPVREALAEKDVIDGKVSDVIELSAEHYLVLQVSQYTPAQQQPLDKVMSSVEAKVRQQEAEAVLQKQVEALLAASQDEMQWNALVKEYGYTLGQSRLLTRHSTEIDSAVVQTAYALPHPVGSERLYGAVKLANGDRAIVLLQNIEDGSYAALPDAKKKDYVVAIGQAMADLEFKLPLAELMEQSKIQRY